MELKKLSYIELLIGQNGLCFYCGKPMSHRSEDKLVGFTKDHFYPKCKGNKLNGNVVLAHRLCNEKKSDREPTKYEKIKFEKLYKKMKIRRGKLKNMRDSFKKNIKKE